MNNVYLTVLIYQGQVQRKFTLFSFSKKSKRINNVGWHPNLTIPERERAQTKIHTNKRTKSRSGVEQHQSERQAPLTFRICMASK